MTSKRFIVLRIDPAISGESYETVGPGTEGHASFGDADAEALALSRRYPHGCFAIFLRRAVYSSAMDTTRRLDRNPAPPKNNVRELRAAKKLLKATS